MDKRLFIIEAMDLFQNTRLQKSLYTLHPITCNIDKHKDCAGLGVGSALTPRPNQTLTLTPTLRLILPFFQRKSTFVARLLPPELRVYYLDHLNLSNKFDKEMALTNNLIVNLDELDAIRPSQHAALKQTLSKSKVNGRPIYGASQDDRPRYASFVATTNNPHPLSDATGSRRYICLTIPEGQYIDNSGEIDYQQLYAQVVHEVKDLKAPYWFNNQQVARIQELNLNYMEQKDIAEVIEACIRKPKEGEQGIRMKSGEIVSLIRREYPSIQNNHSTKIHLGLAMKELGFEGKTHGNQTYYKVIPLKAA